MEGISTHLTDGIRLITRFVDDGELAVDDFILQPFFQSGELFGFLERGDNVVDPLDAGSVFFDRQLRDEKFGQIV